VSFDLIYSKLHGERSLKNKKQKGNYSTWVASPCKAVNIK
jgi:hypothetical protein